MRSNASFAMAFALFLPKQVVSAPRRAALKTTSTSKLILYLNSIVMEWWVFDWWLLEFLCDCGDR